MKSDKNIQKEAAPKQTKKENAQDIISKSILSHTTINYLKGSGSHFNSHLNNFIMSNLKNHVQLIGNIGQDPTIAVLDTGKKVARFSIATNEHYKNSKGEKQTETAWHSIVAWGKLADIVENHTAKGKEIALSGKLKTRSYTDKDNQTHYITEVIADEILLLGAKPSKS